MDKQLNIILTGELDSGKSTLIGRLLFDTHSLSRESEQELRLTKELNFANLLDSFQEERDGEFTLDTTQAIVSYKKIQYTFIDAPGHKELIKNMLTASSYAEAAIVVIDCKKGLEEQTKRHLYILKFLGINSIIVAVNKMDTVSYKKEVFKKTSEEINKFLGQIQLSILSFIPVSAKEGEGLLKKSKKMPWHNSACLMESIDKCIKQKKDYYFRFPIQDIYNINNEIIAVGTIASGDIKLKDKVNIIPFDKKLRVKRIKTFGKKFKFLARAPESIGLILDNAKGLERGHVLYKNKPPRHSRQIFARIFCLKPLAQKETLSLVCSTQETKAVISRINTVIETTNFTVITNCKELKTTDVADITIDLDRPIATEEFKNLPLLGRFLLQKNSEACAIGIIL